MKIRLLTVLEARAAEIFGKEAALFVPTGTMGNTIAIKMHTNHGEEVILRGALAHCGLGAFDDGLVLGLSSARSLRQKLAY